MNMIVKNIAAALSFALVSTLCEAAEPIPIDIKEAIVLTLEDNAALRSLRQEARKAEAFKIQADGTLAPEIGVNAYVDRQRENQTSDGSNRPDNRVARVTLSQTLYSGGRNEALRRQSPQVRTVAELTLIDGENRAVGELFARFYNVLLQESRVQTEEAAIRTSELHLREVTKMEELGLSNRLEVIRAEQQLATNRADLSTAKGLRDTAAVSLNNYMAITPSQLRPVSGKLQVFEIEGSRDASLALAMEKRADRGMMQQQAAYQKNQIEIARSGLRPKIALGASAGYLDPYRGYDRGDDTWRTELSITIPILDRDAARGDVIREQATMEQDRIALGQKELDIRSEVETAWMEYETTLERMDSTLRALELAGETLRLAAIGFQEGVTPQLDLLAAQASFTDIRLQHLGAIYNHMLAVVALKVTEGDIINWTVGREF